MRRVTGVLCALGYLMLCVSCTVSTRKFSTTAPAMAEDLKSFCERHNIQSLETRKADALYALSNVKLQKGQKRESSSIMDLAVIYYRLALAKQEYAQSEKRLEKSREQLVNEQQELSDYREVLREMKGGAQ